MLMYKRCILLVCIVELVKGKGKCKAIPLEAWRGPEGTRRLRYIVELLPYNHHIHSTNYSLLTKHYLLSL
jgi:hypothetical protein